MSEAEKIVYGLLGIAIAVPLFWRIVGRSILNARLYHELPLSPLAPRVTHSPSDRIRPAPAVIKVKTRSNRNTPFIEHAPDARLRRSLAWYIDRSVALPHS